MRPADRNGDGSLADQRSRVDALAACEDRAKRLRDRETDLEVEQMAADAAFHSATARIQPGIDPLLAERLGRALERRDALEQQPPGGTAGTARGLDQLRAGRSALQAWLGAEKDRKPGGLSIAAKLTLLIATVVSIWAAIALHPAFLLILVIVIGPVSFALGRGQDAEWGRVGARRRFETSGLAPLAEWDEASVRARLGELDELIAAAGETRSSARPVDAADAGRDPEETAAAIAAEDAVIASALREAGLSRDDIRGDTGEWIRLAGRAAEARDALDRVRSERGRLREEAEELREHLHRYLRDKGGRATDRPDTAEEISARLDRLPDPD